MTTNQEPYGFIEWLRSHRISLAPLYVAAPVLISGIVANVLLSGLQIAVAMATVALVCVVWINSRVRQGWRRGYISTVIVLAMIWVAWASTLGQGPEPDPQAAFNGWAWAVILLAFGAVVLAIPHWLDKVKKTQVKMENMVRDWPIRGGRIGLGNTTITGVNHTDIGWTARLKWADGDHLVDRVRKQAIEIESALGLESGSLQVSLDGKSNSSVVLNVTLTDPHEKGILWEIPTQRDGDDLRIQTLHGSDQIHVGVRADGTKKWLQVFKPGWGARQVLIAGIKGSGKSGLLNRIWAHFALCDDVVQWGIDLKGGAELGPWAGVFDWIAESRETAMLMIEAAEQLIERRGQLLKKYRWKSWQGSPEHPWLCISIDEAASLLGASASAADIERVAEIARKGRAVGVSLILATQYPTLEALGSSQIRQQIDQRFCFRMADATGEGYVLTVGTAVNAHKIDGDRPGTCYHEDNSKLDPLQMRIVFVGDGSNGTPDTVAQVADLLRGKTPDLDRDSIENGIAELEAYANRERFDGAEAETGIESETPAPDENEVREWTENGEADLLDVTSRYRAGLSPADREAAEARSRSEAEKESRRLGETEARDAVIQALLDAGAAGVAAADLAEVATRKSTWTYDYLKDLEEKGKVKRTGSGTYALDPSLANAG
jgi:S-DNA-T family DNA segregation ATPase FtsK/SpoIIIE